jgi:asparagine synthase (glutamine-hydrolysing)
LGQVRLSIIDLSVAGHQPFFYDKVAGGCNQKHIPDAMDSSHLSIVFNGEIYNYIELKAELEELGYTFTTETDTEVIGAAYLAW